MLRGQHVCSVPTTGVALHSTTRSALPSSLARNSLLPRFNLTGSALLDAPFSDGGRAGTKPNGFELQLPGHGRFEKVLLHLAREVRPQCERGLAQQANS